MTMEIEEIYSRIDNVNEVKKKIERFGDALADATSGKGRDEAIFAEMGLLGVQMLIITNVQMLNEILSCLDGCSLHQELFQVVSSMKAGYQREYNNISSMIKELNI